jgi:hypothetical protein
LVSWQELRPQLGYAGLNFRGSVSDIWFLHGFFDGKFSYPNGCLQKKRAWRLREVCNRQAASPYAIASKETGFD